MLIFWVKKKTKRVYLFSVCLECDVMVGHWSQQLLALNEAHHDIVRTQEEESSTEESMIRFFFFRVAFSRKGNEPSSSYNFVRLSLQFEPIFTLPLLFTVKHNIPQVFFFPLSVNNSYDHTVSVFFFFFISYFSIRFLLILLQFLCSATVSWNKQNKIKSTKWVYVVDLSVVMCNLTWWSMFSCI